MARAEAHRADPRSARQEHILNAAEACFVRNGFHRTTMADIARQAAMSQGNFYRYYASKEAVIEDLAHRDGERAGELIASFQETDPRAAILAVLMRFFGDVSRETAIIRLDLWAEATRNNDIANLLAGLENEAQAWVIEGLSRGGGQTTDDLEALWREISTLLKGMIVNRALVDTYDPSADVRRLERLVGFSSGGEKSVRNARRTAAAGGPSIRA